MIISNYLSESVLNSQVILLIIIFIILATSESINLYSRMIFCILMTYALIAAIFSKHLLVINFVSIRSLLWWVFFLFRRNFFLNCGQFVFFKISLLEMFQILYYYVNKIFVKLAFSLKRILLFVLREICLSSRDLFLVILYWKTMSLFLIFKFLKCSKLSLKNRFRSLVIYLMIQFAYKRMNVLFFFMWVKLDILW